MEGGDCGGMEFGDFWVQERFGIGRSVWMIHGDYGGAEFKDVSHTAKGSVKKFRMPTSQNLVQIRVNFEVEGQRFKDAFTCNPSDFGQRGRGSRFQDIKEDESEDDDVDDYY